MASARERARAGSLFPSYVSCAIYTHERDGEFLLPRARREFLVDLRGLDDVRVLDRFFHLWLHDYSKVADL